MNDTMYHQMNDDSVTVDNPLSSVKSQTFAYKLVAEG